ncbi:VOC family protein [Paraburkholderia unamae]|uniref:Glyoxalase/bleomycin resistance protein/dioxygenase superfamily protein n=1 Tax=Paraburkholderia unamae TaxID=219649 RepID=A0ABX5K9B5_9BURK|nr:VOC family protein [Paraburkholderia unamae]PVX71270.1 glyoxalase/bleomycin resistance protein/dioxygenase superfamily protein [Paraburkholderia unamae]RAR65231.1 glyoxalase/bleomycin resistance protein/dioxygenase superfamily protein [Paraburkholderia unamae]CAG9243933.1 Putative glyoxalase superfamily protein PhnB [Paraburkholderia unamae]
MNERAAQIVSLSAVTLTVSDIARSAPFYEALGFVHKAGPAVPGFASFELAGAAGACYLNLLEGPHGAVGGWGRVILYVADVDAFYAHALAAGATPEFAPRDAPWGERYFHLLDPDGHELSFARPLA